VLGTKDWLEDPRYAGNRARLRNRDALVAELNAILATRPRAAWIAAMEAAGVPCAPINTLAEALEEEQVRALGMIQQVPGESFTLTALPLSIDGVRPQIRGAAPRLGDAA
jgi:formyl-CoA transferase